MRDWLSFGSTQARVNEANCSTTPKRSSAKWFRSTTTWSLRVVRLFKKQTTRETKSLLFTNNSSSSRKKFKKNLIFRRHAAKERTDNEMTAAAIKLAVQEFWAPDNPLTTTTAKSNSSASMEVLIAMMRTPFMTMKVKSRLPIHKRSVMMSFFHLKTLITACLKLANESLLKACKLRICHQLSFSSKLFRCQGLSTLI